MSYEFFFSYAREDQDQYLYQFLEDLNKEVCAALGIRQGSRVGFFDGREIGVGDAWSSQIVHALRTSKVMVCLYSQAYFCKPFCGKEWAFFNLRRKATQTALGYLPPVILPVLWKPPTLIVSAAPKVPPLPEAIDSIVAEIQYTYGAEQAIYNIEGLRFALYQKRNYEADYNDYIYQLARRIVQAGKEYPLPDLPEVPSLADIVPAFPSHAAGLPLGSVMSKPTAGPRHVRFIIVAADPNIFGNSRDPSAYHDNGGGDWKPYLPEQLEELGPYVQNIVSSRDLRFTTDICPFGESLYADVESAWKERKLVVILVDGWTVSWDPKIQNALRELAGVEEFRNCTFLVPWNDKDPEIMAHGKAIDKLLHKTFQSRFSMGSAYFRDGIRSLDELKATLVKVLIDLKAEIHKEEPDRPVPPGSPVPIVSATGGGA
jgi:FxsC-like protein